MTTCSVLHCQEAGSAVLESPKLGGFEALVCPDHKAAADNGSPWITHKDSRSLLMGNDVPPGLAKWTLEETVGTGAVLTIETDREGEKPFKLYLDKESRAFLGKAFPQQTA
jgi:hypothetical protein